MTLKVKQMREVSRAGPVAKAKTRAVNRSKFLRLCLRNFKVTVPGPVALKGPRRTVPRLAGNKSKLDLAFRDLVRQWKAGRGHSSSPRRLAQHPAYRAIVAMGWPAVPLLLAELQRSPDLWFSALREITKQDPVTEEAKGDLAAMASAWLGWGRRHGYAR